jgi:hypothetical protein
MGPTISCSLFLEARYVASSAEALDAVLCMQGFSASGGNRFWIILLFPPLNTAAATSFAKKSSHLVCFYALQIQLISETRALGQSTWVAKDKRARI